MIRLFVAGYPREATTADIAQLFRQFGASEADVTFPRDRRSRRKKGYAYVNLPNAEAAEAAIKTFANFALDGKPLTIIRAEDRPLKRRR